MKLQLVLFVTFSVMCYLAGRSHGVQDDLAVLDSIYSERDCIHQGGLCVKQEDCPPGHLTAVKGLCPTQRSKGVECCYAQSVKETRCKRRGGDCVRPDNCNAALVVRNAADCPSDRVCCIYL